MKRRLFAFAAGLAPSFALAATPLLVSNQGRLLDGNDQAVTGSHRLKFSVYKKAAPPAPGSNETEAAVWSDAYDVSFDAHGTYTVVLGDAATGADHRALTSDAFAEPDRFLAVSVDGGPELQPRLRFTSGAYAAVAGAINGGPVNASRIDVGAVPVVDATGHFVGPTDNLPFHEKSAADARFALKTELGAVSDSLASYATIASADAKFATKTELSAYAKSADLAALGGTYYTLAAADAKFAAKTDLAPYAKTADLAPYAKTADLAAYAKASDLAGLGGTYYTLGAADSKFATRSDLAAYPAANAIVAGKASITGQLNPGESKTQAAPSGTAQLFTSAWASFDAGTSWKNVPLAMQPPLAGYGTGRDGAITFPAGTTAIDGTRTRLNATAAAGATSLPVASGSGFAVNQLVLLVQVQGGIPGTFELHRLASAGASSLGLAEPIRNTFTTGAIALRVPEYTDVTVPAGATVTASAWDGSTGGIVAFVASGTVTVNGTISATGLGFRGGVSGASGSDYVFNQAGEGQYGAGPNRVTASGLPNGLGGASGCGTSAGGGGAGAFAGQTPNVTGCICGSTQSLGGTPVGGDHVLAFGGGGGASGSHSGNGRNGAPGGAGGGVVFVSAKTLVVNGGALVSAIGASGGAGYIASPNYQPQGGGGGGGGGTVHLQTDSSVVGAGLVIAAGGAGGSYGADSFASGGCNPGSAGGAGGPGRVIVSRPLSLNASPQARIYGAGEGGVLVGLQGSNLVVTSLLPQSATVKVDFAY